jgi:hypothetical protein
VIRASESEVQVGSYLLDTLTVGMYEDAFHCIREYIQNAFDSINDAVAAGVLSRPAASVSVKVVKKGKLTLSIRDNGQGVSAAKVFETLISVGNSRKNQTKHAGFRGIGRLAGVAYCNTLRFTTKVAGEANESVVEYDCSSMRGFIAPGCEPLPLQKVISSCVTVQEREAKAADHYMLVELVGLHGDGLLFAEMEALVDYLSEHAPVDYGPAFPAAQEIYDLAESIGQSVQVIPITVTVGRDVRSVHKRIGSHIVSGKHSAKIMGIHPISSKELGLVGWFADAEYFGEVSDARSAGVRFRQKNIQVGGAQIIERIAAEVETARSNRRLMRWVVGEIFVFNPKVVPNARRDGFEDNDAWEKINNALVEFTKAIVKAVRKSSDRRVYVERIVKKIEEHRSGLTGRSEVSREERTRIEAELRQQLDRIARAGDRGVDPKRLQRLKEEIETLKGDLHSKPIAAPALGPLLTRILQIVESEMKQENVLSTASLKRIMKRIESKLRSFQDNAPQ